jgi:hypothetical protein
VLPSISIDESFCCIVRSVAFAEVLYSSRRTWSLCCTDVLLHLQKFCPVLGQLAWQRQRCTVANESSFRSSNEASFALLAVVSGAANRANELLSTGQKTLKSAQVGPKSVQVCPKCAEVGPKSVQVGPKSAQVGQKCAQLSSKCVQVGPKSVLVGPKSVQVGLKLAPRASKLAPSWSPKPPSGPQVRPSWSPRSLQDASRSAWSAKQPEPRNLTTVQRFSMFFQGSASSKSIWGAPFERFRARKGRRVALERAKLHLVSPS